MLTRYYLLIEIVYSLMLHDKHTNTLTLEKNYFNKLVNFHEIFCLHKEVNFLEGKFIREEHYVQCCL